ncbi:hypothetical protein HN873_029308, partial [Arachis hypogaea]
MSWLTDYATSNHMTISNSLLQHVRQYHGFEQIQVVDINIIPIYAIGDISFSHIFLFIEKIVENNYDVHFSRNGCSIYDLVLGTIFTPTLITLCSLVANKISFLHLFNSSLLGESEQLLTSHLSFDCATCKFGKNKVLPFQTMNSHAIKYFYIIYSDIWKISPVILM